MWPRTREETLALADEAYAAKVLNAAILGPCLVEEHADVVELRVRAGLVSVEAQRAGARIEKSRFPAALLPAVACRLLVMGGCETFAREATASFPLAVAAERVTVVVEIRQDEDEVWVRLACVWSPLPG